MSTNPPAPTPSNVLFCSKCGASVAPGVAYCPKCAAPQPGAYVAPMPRMQYAGFWIRFLAILLDGIILSIVFSPISFGIFGLMGVSAGLGNRSDSAQIMALLIPAIVVVASIGLVAKWLYEALLTSSSKQATIGKMACGLRVTDLQGRRLTFARATGRFFAKYISGLTLLIGYIMAGFTERKQALHDFIAGTYVIKG